MFGAGREAPVRHKEMDRLVWCGGRRGDPEPASHHVGRRWPEPIVRGLSILVGSFSLRRDSLLVELFRSEYCRSVWPDTAVEPCRSAVRSFPEHRGWQRPHLSFCWRPARPSGSVRTSRLPTLSGYAALEASPPGIQHDRRSRDCGRRM